MTISHPGRLSGRVAVVTGAVRGIGLATTRRLAAEGARLVLGDRDSGVIGEVIDQLPSGTAVACVGDLADPVAAERLVTTAVDTFDALDIVVNNAGVTRDRMFHRMSSSDLDDVLDANLRTAWNVTRAAVPVMRAKAKDEISVIGSVDHHRKVVLTSSVAALTGNPGQANYTAAKGALISLTRTLAQELGPFAINVNAVAPGFIETRLTAEKTADQRLGIPADIRERIRGMISLGRFGRPDDVAAATAFLVSPDSDYISGITVPVTGGQFGGMG